MTMKDKWLEDIKGKISDFEMESPDGLWESIVEELPVLDRVDYRKQTGKPWRKIISMAASIVLLLGLTVFFYWVGGNDESTDMRLDKMASNQMQDLKSDFKSEKTSGSINSQMIVKSGHDKVLFRSEEINENVSSKSLADLPEDKIQVESPKDLKDSKDSKDSKDLKDPKAPKDSKDSSFHPGSDLLHESPSKNVRILLAASVSASGAGDSMVGSGSSDNGTGHGIFMDADNSAGDETRMGGLIIDQSLLPDFQSEEVFDHKQPLRFGVDIAWKFNKNVSLESGLCYTLLNSDIRYGRKINQDRAKQSLHYVGIPLSIRFSPFVWNNIELYVKGGILLEKCVAGKISTRTMTSTPYTYDGSGERPFQISVNASAGVQYDITRHCGIFVQPGIGYYFNDGSSLRTIYKQHPLNFDLNIGFRFSLPQN